MEWHWLRCVLINVTDMQEVNYFFCLSGTAQVMRAAQFADYFYVNSFSHIPLPCCCRYSILIDCTTRCLLMMARDMRAAQLADLLLYFPCEYMYAVLAPLRCHGPVG